MLQYRRALARGREGRFSYRASAMQARPDLGRQSNLLQTPCQALSHPARTLRRSTARNRNQNDSSAEGHGEAPATCGLQPDPCGEMWQPSSVRGLQARA